MGIYLGIDTSNYTTSCAVYNTNDKSVIQNKRLLPVKPGELGIRQSDAVFHHTVSLPEIVEKTLYEAGNPKIDAVSVSTRPRNVDGSYMPCFLAGVSAARSIAAALNVPCSFFSHQQGHIAAALYSAQRLDLIGETFIAFQLSGGTTEALLSKPSKNNNDIIDLKYLAGSLDLKAGQAVDRIGVMLGLDFPAGMALDELAQKSNKEFKLKPFLRGADCSFSGLQNKAQRLFEAKNPKEDVAKYCFDYIKITIDKMITEIKKEYGDLPVVFSGGVMSNTIVNKYITEKHNAYFASPMFSSDNAAGIAILGSIRNEINV